jgi:hypothetical protein
MAKFVIKAWESISLRATVEADTQEKALAFARENWRKIDWEDHDRMGVMDFSAEPAEEVTDRPVSPMLALKLERLEEK